MGPARASNPASSLAERIAFGATLACLAHCLALPLVVAALPAIARLIPFPEAVHVGALVLAVPTSGYALLSGWAHSHRDWRPAVVGAAGLAALAAGALVWGHDLRGTAVTVCGSLLLVAAHLANFRLRRRGPR